MIPILYFRSSSINAARLCLQQYFIRYVLGHDEASNKKADKGTIFHRCMEILAVIKQGMQNGEHFIEDSIVGIVDVNNFDMTIIVDVVFDFYSKKSSHHIWLPLDRKHIHKWLKKALALNDSYFDPLNQNILEVEKHFDFIMEDDRFKYDYVLSNKEMSGNLGLKGTIDLIISIDEDTIEIIDYKTGSRDDWITGIEKTQASFQKDIQLRLYHYAIQKLYPTIRSVMVTIYYINDGGPFTVMFNEKDVVKTEEMIKFYFDAIKNSEKPTFLYHTRPEQSWKCSKTCYFGKNTFEGHESIEPKIEHRSYRKRHGQAMSMCDQIGHETYKNGTQWVIENMSALNNDLGNYQAPGN